MIRKMTGARARRGLSALGMLVLFSAIACRKSEEKKPDPETKTTAAAVDKQASKAPKDEGIEVPTEEDFEATVEAQITAETDLQKELDEIEKQIGQ